jgi:microcystin-dependent protein
VASQPYLGAIFLFAGNFAPRGYLLCNGQLLPIQQYAALFSILGTSYGGNGTSTFALPNLQGRAAIGQGTGAGLTTVVLGEVAGTENVSVGVTNMPQHNHLVSAVSGGGNQTTPTGNLPAALGVTHPPADFPGLAPYSNSAANTTLATNTLTSVGGSVPLGIRNPYLGLTYIIAITGLFPSRS